MAENRKKILIVGSGAVSSALARKLRQISRIEEIFVAPSNGIDSDIYKKVDLREDDLTGLLKFVLALVIILAVLLATYLIKEWNIIGIIGTILSVISPVFIGFVIAWLLDPLATKFSHKMPRVLACILT